METSALNVFDYQDYRELLRDAYRARRTKRAGWSYEVWARQLGLKSPSTLAMILKGQRNPSPRLASALSKWMRLDPESAGYFHDLVRLARTRHDAGVASLLLQRLRARARVEGQAAPTFVDPADFAAISRWYYYAIRECVQLKAFQEDEHWLQSHLAFPIEVAEAREALRTLLRKGLLQRNGEGRLELGHGNLEVSSEIADEAIQLFHEQALANAARSLRTMSPEKREVRGTTFAMPKAKLPQARELIRKFQNDLCDLLEGKETDAVYHLEIALFPVAEARGEKTNA